MNQLGKFNGVLLVSDFDDTLYGEDMRITRENVEALMEGTVDFLIDQEAYVQGKLPAQTAL